MKPQNYPRNNSNSFTNALGLKILMCMVVLLIGLSHPIQASTCFQETANQSTLGDGTCGLSYLGNYSTNFNTNPGNTYDGNINTQGYGLLLAPGEFNVTYVKPSGVSNGTFWELKTGSGTWTNLTIPSHCFDKFDTQLILRYRTEHISHQYGWADCWNGTWNQIQFIGDAQLELYEDRIYWNSTAPVTFLDAPVDNYASFTTNVSFNCSAMSTETNIANISLYTNYSGAWTLNRTYAYSGSKVANASFNNTYVDGDKFGWTCQACTSGSICKFASLNRTIQVRQSLGETKIGYNQATFESQAETYQLNITYRSIDYTANATFIFNGTRYPYSTQTGTGDTISFLRNLDMPLVGGANNYSLYWEIVLTNSTGNYYFNSTFGNQTINPIYLYPCNSTYSISYINFTFKDEETLAWINASVNPLTLQYYLGDGSVYRTLSYSNLSEIPSVAFCFSPSYQTLNTNGFNLRYSATGYETRNTFFSSTLSNVTTNKTLFLLKTTTGLYVTIQIINQALQPISNVFVNASNSFGLVGSGYTDSAGGITFFLNPTLGHEITATKSGYNFYTTTITPTQSSYTITLGLSGASTSSIVDHSRGIIYSFVPVSSYLNNNTFYLFNLSMLSTYWSLDNWGFNITNNNNSLIYNVQSALAIGGSLSSNITTGTNQSYLVTIYWTINGTRTQVYKYYTIWNDADTGFSILNFVNDLRTYLSTDDGIFGLKQGFSLNLVIFFTIFIITGIMSWKFGLYSPVVIAFMIFALTALFDSGLGLISNFNDKEGLATLITGIAFVGLFIKEATGY
jgi:hypothetical protein